MNNFINQIKNQQQKDGSFLDSAESPSVIYTSLILSCLSHCKETAETKNIKKKAVDFLLSRKDEDWKFGGDTLNTFCILAALAEYDKELIDGAAIAKILNGLVNLEVQEGGPYYSQNATGDIEKVIDSATNASIARFLKLLDVELPNLESFRGILDMTSKIADALNLAPMPALSAAISLETFNRAEQSNKKKHNNEICEIHFDDAERQMMDKIMEAAEKRFSGLNSEMKNLAMNGIKKTINGNRDKQMSLMAYYTKQALGKKADKVSDSLAAEMGLANIFFWTAFIIYDDFWDEDEAADPRILPVANLYARSYIDFFNSILPESTGFRIFFHDLMDGLDSANNWETIHCRAEVRGSKFIIPENLPDYGDYEFKYRPASGNILGPVAMLVQLGYGLDSSEVKNLISYFRNYLIAMQINDDAHDWEEDMKRGHLSTAVVMLLKELNWTKKEIDLETDLMELKKVFWFKAIEKIAQTAINHTEKSREHLRSITVLENPAMLERFIDLTEGIAKKALKEQKESMDFLRTYKG